MLATSGQISTVSEPWILLPFVYTLKYDGIRSEYGHSLSVQAIQDFYKQFPNGRQDYLHELREFILKLYQKNTHPESTYFLDKTPRYHLIINEIQEIFPEGKFIFLWRNPLAVVSSVIHSWCQGKWKPRTWQMDLYDGTKNLINAFRENCPQVHALQYENLIQSPSTEMKKICDYLLIEYNDQMIDSFQNISLKGKLGDRKGTKKYNSLSTNSLHSWQTTFNNPIRRHWAIRYLDWLGEENLRTMGYSYHDLKDLASNGGKIKFNDMFSDLIRSAFHPAAHLLATLRENYNNNIKHFYH